MGATAGAAIGGCRANPLLPLLVAFFLTGTAHAVVFTLRPGRSKCITEGLRGSAVSVARYRVAGVGGNGVAPEKHKIRVRVRDPMGKSIRRVESVESGEFAFLAKRTGRYSACFWTPRSNSSASISIDLEWRSGNATHNWQYSVARESKIEMQAQMQEGQARKQALRGPDPSAAVGAKAYASTEDMASGAASVDAEGEEDDEDDNEDGGKGDRE